MVEDEWSGEGDSSSGWPEEEASRRRRSFVWPLIAAFVAVVAVGHIVSLKRRLLDFSRLGRQASSSRHSSDPRQKYKSSFWTFTRGTNDKGQEFIYRQTKYSSFEPDWQSFAEAAVRMRHMKLMQEAFLKERFKIFQRWEEIDWKQYDQYFGGNHWYWDGQGWTNLGMDGKKTNWKTDGQRPKFDFGINSRKSAQVHHYSVLGLDPKRADAYTDAEIKAAFRAKAMEYHPDRNQHRKDYAETKFKEVMESYQALKGKNV